MKPLFTFLTFFTLFTFLLSFTFCKNSVPPQTNLVTLDILPALTNYKEFRLSQLVDSIEYVKLETRPEFIFLIGDEKERFHLVYNTATKETFRLPKLGECRKEGGYPYGIINDLDGTDPVWFWANVNVRNNQISNLLQIVDLKEKIKTDCFIKSDLKTGKYRDQLRKLVEESEENDNPAVRILWLGK